MTDLIDTTEMYLRTIYELTEEGVRPMRARIAERLAQSGPTVSQTVARMQRDGLVELDAEDRHLVLTGRGATLAMRVMRKHRLAECLLVEVIGLPWEDVHTEACRWEHVMSEAVERRLLELLNQPDTSPFGNPIPGLAELTGTEIQTRQESVGPVALPGANSFLLTSGWPAGVGRTVRVVRIGEILQSDPAAMLRLNEVGANPGALVNATKTDTGVLIGSIADPTQWLEMAPSLASQLVVAEA